MTAPTFKILSYQQRYSQTWYCVRAYRLPIMQWIRNQPNSHWMEIHGRIDRAGYGIDGKRFLIDKKLYMWFLLRWS